MNVIYYTVTVSDLQEIALWFCFLAFFASALGFCAAWSVKKAFIIFKDIFFHSKFYQARMKRLGLHVVYVNGNRYVRRVDQSHG